MGRSIHETRQRRVPGGNNSPFGVRALARLAAERTHSTGAVSPEAKSQDDDGGDDGNEADEITEGADQYADDGYGYAGSA
ncbi:hypothetical protein [Streptomyces hokutonensis]|uniref:hypothetical protein n=1 Tax=Streptomyces hokutonensis TaxID=1306990 RepID=UPI0036B6F004